MNEYRKNYVVQGVVSLLILNILVVIIAILRVSQMCMAGISELAMGVVVIVLYCVVADYAFVAGTLLLGKIEIRDSIWILTPAVVSHVVILAIIASTARDIFTFVGLVLPIVTTVVTVFTLKRTAPSK